MLGKVFLSLYEWGLRFIFGTVFVGVALVFVLLVVDVATLERMFPFIERVKVKPYKVSTNLWAGGYLRDEKLKRFVKEKRIKVVVSLLDTNMIHEKRLLNRERKLLKRLGVKLYSFPINPIFKDRAMIRRAVKTLQKNRRRRVYLHGYFGRFRVRSVLEELNAR